MNQLRVYRFRMYRSSYDRAIFCSFEKPLNKEMPKDKKFIFVFELNVESKMYGQNNTNAFENRIKRALKLIVEKYKEICGGSRASEIANTELMTKLIKSLIPGIDVEKLLDNSEIFEDGDSKTKLENYDERIRHYRAIQKILYEAKDNIHVFKHLENLNELGVRFKTPSLVYAELQQNMFKRNFRL